MPAVAAVAAGAGGARRPRLCLERFPLSRAPGALLPVLPRESDDPATGTDCVTGYCQLNSGHPLTNSHKRDCKPSNGKAGLKSEVTATLKIMRKNSFNRYPFQPTLNCYKRLKSQQNMSVQLSRVNVSILNNRSVNQIILQ